MLFSQFNKSLAQVIVMSFLLPLKQRLRAFEESLKTLADSTDEVLTASSFMNWATMLLLAYFGGRLLFFALSISSIVTTDEVTHAGLCKVFSKVFLLPGNTPESYEFGLATNIPWLYYWIMGKLLHFNFFGISNLVFLRLLNIPLAFGTVFFTWRTLLLMTRDRLTQLLLVVAMTNTTMFTLLSASVSYDNLTNLLAAMAVYFLLAFFKDRSGNLLAAAILCQLAGCLTKFTFLPLVLVLNVLLFVHEFRNLRFLPASLRSYIQASGRRALLLAVPILITLCLNLQLYGGNYLHYGTLNPSMATILSSKAAMNYRLDARGMIFNQYKEGKISYMEALIMAGEIKHPGDKADTFYLLMNYENLKRNPQLWMGPLAYSGVWFENMVGSIFGIKAHLIMAKDFIYRIPLYVILALSLLGFAVRWRPRESGRLPPCLLAIIGYYSGYLIYEINYDSYLNYGAPGLTLYGRYLFPVMCPVYVLVSVYLLRLFRNDYIRCALALATALLLISYDFPWFLAHVTPEWYAHQSLLQ